MSVHIDNQLLETGESIAERSSPFECCGFLLGTWFQSDKDVEAIVPAVNVAPDAQRHQRYLISPEDFVRCQKMAWQNGWQIVGFYHSHPNAPSEPSKIDLLYAWPWYVYLILSVCGESCTASAWRLQENRRGFYRERLVPEKITDLSQHRERDRFCDPLFLKDASSSPV